MIVRWTNNSFRALGYIKGVLDDEDPRSAKEQLHESYAHGGGWQPFKGFELTDDDGLKYPGDPVQLPVSTAKLRDEVIHLYPSAWVAIIQPDRSFEVSRMAR